MILITTNNVPDANKNRSRIEFGVLYETPPTHNEHNIIVIGTTRTQYGSYDFTGSFYNNNSNNNYCSVAYECIITLYAAADVPSIILLLRTRSAVTRYKQYAADAKSPGRNACDYYA